MAVAGAYMVHFRTQDRALLQRWGIAWHYQSGSGTIIAQNDDDVYTLQAWLVPGADPNAMRPEAVLENWVGRKFDYEILQANPWTANFVVAARYRQGRIFLAGDSAHQFIPTGGYGMNSGIADAAGLAWVLSARIRGWGGDTLLDAYDAERRPTAWWHLDASRRHMGVRVAISEIYAQAGDMEGPQAAQKRAEVARKIEMIGNAENESWGVELGYRYDESPIIATEPDAPAIDPLTYVPTTWPGSRLPHVFLEDGISVHDKLGLYFTLICLEEADCSAMQAAAEELNLDVALTILQLGRPDLRGIYERNFLLVRPDQHVAWRGDELPAEPKLLLRQVVGR
jgi:hypothetical protein